MPFMIAASTGRLKPPFGTARPPAPARRGRGCAGTQRAGWHPRGGGGAWGSECGIVAKISPTHGGGPRLGLLGGFQFDRKAHEPIAGLRGLQPSVDPEGSAVDIKLAAIVRIALAFLAVVFEQRASVCVSRRAWVGPFRSVAGRVECRQGSLRGCRRAGLDSRGWAPTPSAFLKLLLGFRKRRELR